MCSFCHKKSDAQQKTYEAEKCALTDKSVITSSYKGERGREKEKERKRGEREKEKLPFHSFFLFKITFVSVV